MGSALDLPGGVGGILGRGVELGWLVQVVPHENVPVGVDQQRLAPFMVCLAVEVEDKRKELNEGFTCI